MHLGQDVLDKVLFPSNRFRIYSYKSIGPSLPDAADKKMQHSITQQMTKMEIDCITITKRN